MATESTSLLSKPTDNNVRGRSDSSARRRVDASKSPLREPTTSPNLRTIKLEDHRPGRPTTFSLLQRGAGGSRDSSLERGAGNLRTYDSVAAMPSAVLSINPPNGTGSSAHAHVSGLETPYRFGDGTTGYQIVFPRSDDDVDVQTASIAAARVDFHVNCAIWLSLAVNIVLFVSKTYSAVASHSLSVAASAVDSLLDLASQAIVFAAERGSRNVDANLYPAGRSRLEPVGIIVCAAIMGCAALQLVLESASQLVVGFTGSLSEHAEVDFTLFSLGLLLLTIVGKLGLWLYCAAFAKHSPTLFALAVDHRNDVLSNIVALVAAVVAWYWPSAWAADPVGAIVMSLYIVWNWTGIALEQIEHIVGRAADPSFIEEIRDLSSGFHAQLVPDLIRAYHFGSRYLVELEVVLPAEMTVREAHDISLALQQSIEQLEAVERAFVHVDWRGRDGEDEHDADLIATKLKTQPAATTLPPSPAVANDTQA